MRRKTLTILLALSLIFSMAAVSVSAIEKTQDGVLAEQTTDKAEYKSTDNITTTLTVTNQNDTAITNVKLTNIVPKGYHLVSGEIRQKVYASVDAGKTATLTTTFAPDKGTDTPETGDMGNGALIYLVIALACAACIALILRSKKVNKNILMILVFCLVAGAGMVTFGDSIFAITGDPASMTLTTEVTVSGKTLPVDSAVSYEKAVPEYTVTFYTLGHGMVTPTSVKVQEGTTVAAPEVLLAEGYTFGGWYEDPDCTDAWDFTNDKVMSDIELYAKWTANTYKVIYNANKGAGEMSEQEFTYDIAQNLRENVFYWSDHEFIGWNTDKDATEALYTNEKEVKNLTSENGATVTLYAIWKLVDYTVQFDLNGIGGTYLESKTVSKGNLVPKPEGWSEGVTLREHTLEGWYSDQEYKNKWNFDEDTVGSDITLYAKWKCSIRVIIENSPSFPAVPHAWYSDEYTGTSMQIDGDRLRFIKGTGDQSKDYPLTKVITKNGSAYYIYDTDMTIKFNMNGDTITSVTVSNVNEDTTWWAEGTYSASN